ncbi:MAG: hypothetical protein ACRCR7_12265 [Weissella cibaria]
MSAFNLGDYVDVPTRLAEALKRWPNLRIQETRPVIVTVDNQAYVEISCTVWRDDTDPLPTTAYCWEPIPGRTPYTKGSEMMNASTSCLGRALGFLGMGIGKSIASRNEVQARQPAVVADVTPIRDDLEQPFGDTTDTKQYASPKQRGMIRARAFEKKIGTTQLMPYINKLLGTQHTSVEALNKREASQVIDSLQN